MFPLLKFCFILSCHGYLTPVTSDESCIDTVHVPSVSGKNVTITCNTLNTLDCCTRGLWRGKGEKWLLPDNCEDCGDTFSVTNNLLHDINILQISNISKSDVGIYICQCDVLRTKEGCNTSNGRMNFCSYNVTIPDCKLQYEVNGVKTNLYGSFETKTEVVVHVRENDTISVHCVLGSSKTKCSQHENESLIRVELSHDGCTFHCTDSRDTATCNILIVLNVTSNNTSTSVVTPVITDRVLPDRKTFGWTTRTPKTNILTILTSTIETSSLRSTNGLSSDSSHVLIGNTNKPRLNNTVDGLSSSEKFTSVVSTTINKARSFLSTFNDVSMITRSNDEFYHEMTSDGLSTTSKASDPSTKTATVKQMVNISTQSSVPANDIQVIRLSFIMVGSGAFVILFCVGIFLCRTGRQCTQVHDDEKEEWVNPIYESADNRIQLKPAHNQHEDGQQIANSGTPSCAETHSHNHTECNAVEEV